MHVRASERISHPAVQVFETLRDKTPDLVAFMPNIERVEVLTEERRPNSVYLYNKWHGSKSDVPRLLRPVIRKDLLTWFDRATWQQDTLQCTWQIESTIGKDFFTCEGTTTIVPDGAYRCIFLIEGEMHVDPDRVPGLPKLLSRKLKGPMERFIAKTLTPNLTKAAEAVQHYLDQKRKESNLSSD